MTEENIYSWEKINGLCKNLISQIDYSHDVIVPILRGGMIPGSILAYHHFNKFGAIDIQPIIWQTRDNQKSEIQKLIKIFNSYKKILIVDDLIDSGLTFNQIDQQLNNVVINLDSIIEFGWDITIAVLMYNKSLEYQKPTIGNLIYGEVIDKEFDPRWIKFPWDD